MRISEDSDEEIEYKEEDEVDLLNFSGKMWNKAVVLANFDGFLFLKVADDYKWVDSYSDEITPSGVKSVIS